MKYLTSLLALTRLRMLKRHWKMIRQLVDALPHDKRAVLAAMVYGESQRAAKHPAPQFYASSPTVAYAPWGDAAESAFERIQGSDEQQRMQGLATWLAVVFHETRLASLAGMKALHGDVAGALERYKTLHERVLAIRMAA